MEFAGLSHYFILLCLPFGLLCANINVPINGNPASDTDGHLAGRIISGNRAERGQFPHQASVRRRFTDAHFAGGVIIAPQWVLTVANIVLNREAKHLSVAAGHVENNEHSSFIQRRNVSALIVHKDFDLRTLSHNIALLKLSTPFDLSTPFVKVATLGKQMPLPGTQCDVSGWGIEKYGSILPSGYLKFVKVPIFEESECKKYSTIAKYIRQGTFCAGYEDGSQGTCFNDEGGALICNNAVFGLVSMQVTCWHRDGPGIYTDVPHNYNWVIDQMKTHDETTH